MFFSEELSNPALMNINVLGTDFLNQFTLIDCHQTKTLQLSEEVYPERDDGDKFNVDKLTEEILSKFTQQFGVSNGEEIVIWAKK